MSTAFAFAGVTLMVGGYIGYHVGKLKERITGPPLRLERRRSIWDWFF